MRYIQLLIIITATLSASLLDFKYLKDAKEAYRDKNYTVAQELYAKVKNDASKFNEADALYRQKRYKEAIEAYQSISDPKLEAKKLHNIGNSYANMKKIDEAIASYEEALKLGEDADTKFNLELLKKKKEEQKKKDKDKKKEKNKDKKNDKDKNKEKDKKNEKDKNKEEQKSKEEKKKEAQKKKEEQKKKEKEKKEKEKKSEKEKNKEEQKKKEPEPPISNMEERKWQKMLNQRGVNTLMIPLNKGEKKNDANPW